MFRPFVVRRSIGGRAAARLHMTQPPLSRAMHLLEADLGTRLLEHTPTGVVLTSAGETLHTEARALLEQAERLTARVRTAAGRPRITIGSLADAAELVATRLVTPFRRAHPHVSVGVHEGDLSDALADQASVAVESLTGRRWVRLPGAADPAWTAYWTGPAPDAGHPVVRTIQECLQSVLWDGMSALAPLDQVLPAGLTAVRATDREPSRLVLAWRAGDPGPLVRSFVDIAVSSFRRGTAPPER